jgi:RNA polymerase sigma factor (TIGR02999 family)
LLDIFTAVIFEPMSEVTQILQAIEGGDAQATNQLFAIVYDELRRVAARQLAQERPGQTLDATALVHEAYLRLVGKESGNRWEGKGHFCASAALAMRRILVDAARRKGREKRGGNLHRHALQDQPGPGADSDLVALDEALTRLEAEDPIASKIVTLHHFAGLSHEAIAQTVGISIYQARQKWSYARAWLKESLKNE